MVETRSSSENRKSISYCRTIFYNFSEPLIVEEKDHENTFSIDKIFS